MWAVAIVQLDNATPIIPSLEKSVIRGIRGSVGRSRCTRRSPKADIAVCWCGFDDQRNDRSLEVPTWMFEPAACDHLRLAGHADRELPRRWWS